MTVERILEIPPRPELRIEPLYLLRPLADYDSEYAVYVSIGNNQVFDRNLDFDVKHEDDPIMFLKTVISDGSFAVQQMIRQAYQDKMALKIGNLLLAYGEWSQMLNPAPFYRPRTIAKILEMPPPDDCNDDTHF